MDNQSLRVEEFCTPFTSEGCGNGLCNAEGTFCTCTGEYVHGTVKTNDTIGTSQISCRETARIAILVVLGFICLSIALAALFVMRGTRKMPRFICQLVVLCSLAHIMHFVALGLEGKPGIASMIFLVFVHTLGGCIAPFSLLWALVSPTLALMMLKHKLSIVLRRMKILSFLFFCEQCAVFFTAVAFQYNGDYRTFNVIVASQFFIIAFYVLLWIVALKYYSRILFVQMDKILGSMSDSKQQRLSKSDGAIVQHYQLDKVAEHREKLGRAISWTIPLCVFAALLCAAFCVLYFGLRIHPFRFVIFFFYMLVFPLFNAILLVFVYRKAVHGTSSNEGGTSGDSRQQTAPNTLITEIADNHGGKMQVSSANSEMTSHHFGSTAVISPHATED